MTAASVPHTSTCTQPDEFDHAGKQGGMLRRCRTCHKFAVIVEPGEVPQVAHLDGCSADPAKVRHYIGHKGDPMAGCSECGRYSYGIAPTPEPAPVAATWSPYRCRSHHGQSVDRRGRGCPECQRERRPRRRQKPAPIEWSSVDTFDRLELTGRRP